MKRIHQLSKNIINQIAAGEVIERPASVVKELVENSIDAGASKISIEISNECKNIRVADNGSGIHPDDIVLAFSKHATSKIENGEDLYNIHTLGFRGEALASIISISKVICITRTSEYDYGTKVVCENSEVEYSKIGCAVGTVMEISDLFYNIPARLKFLKSERTELAYITELVTAIALANPNVSIELKNCNKTILKTNSSENTATVIKTVFSKDTVEHLKEVKNEDKIGKLSISGYVCTPDFTRSNKKDYHIFVNNRTVKCPVFIKAIDTAYRNSLPLGRYPFVVLNLEIMPEDIDINVHPAKKEVKYKNANQVFNFIRSSVERALVHTGESNKEMTVVNIEKYFPPEPVFVDESVIKPERFMQALSNIEKRYQGGNYEPDSDVFEQKRFEQKSVITEPVKPREKIIGQYKNTYILIEKEEGLEIIDQHIADERYIYETLKSQHEPASQLLFVSDVIKIDLKEAEIIKNGLDKFKKFGYGIEFISDTEIIFRKIPQMLSRCNPKELLNDILDNMSDNMSDMEEKILITTSCKAAVKANTQLNLFQMEEIISRWRTCKNPYTCPHGRPISKIIKHNELAGFFMRNN